jgi:hypothetical protein
MKKFIIKIFIFLVPLIILGAFIELLLRQIPNEYSYKKNYLDNNSNKIEKLFLGSSHTYYGVNPSFIGGNSFNASHESQTLNYDYKIFKKYENDWANLKFIIIPIDYFSLFSINEFGKQYWRLSRYNIYYNFNLSSNISDYFEILSLNFRHNLSQLYSYYILKIEKEPCSKLGFGKIYPIAEDIAITGKRAAKRHTKMDFSYYSMNIDILKSFINIAQSRKIQVILYTTPAYRTYVSNLNKKQLDLTINTAIEFANNYSNCTYFNLLEDHSFNADDFSDADHFNLKGAKKFSIKLDSIIDTVVNRN